MEGLDSAGLSKQIWFWGQGLEEVVVARAVSRDLIYFDGRIEIKCRCSIDEWESRRCSRSRDCILLMERQRIREMDDGIGENEKSRNQTKKQVNLSIFSKDIRDMKGVP